MSVRLSFIVPCYNVEKLLPLCLDSIFNCDLSIDEFEVICVNDCSPDNLSSVLVNYSQKYPNLRIISHTSNRGLGGARNSGILASKGDYLWFVDADDLICTKSLSKVIELCSSRDLDVLCFNYQRINETANTLSKHIVFKNSDVVDGYSFVRQMFGERFINHMGFVWRFIYRTSFLRKEHLLFPEKTYWEDTIFMPETIFKAEKIASIPDILYSYRVNPDSISGTFSKNYPAKMIYDYAFICGKGLLLFSDSMRQGSFKDILRNTAINKYINGFSIHLLRTDRQERKRFYTLTKEKPIDDLYALMNPMNKLFLLPFCGPVVCAMAAQLYKLKHKSK